MFIKQVHVLRSLPGSHLINHTPILIAISGWGFSFCGCIGGWHRQRGAAFIESAIVIPVILLITAGVVSLGTGLTKQIELARIVYETTRDLSSTRSLQPGTLVFDSKRNECKWHSEKGAIKCPSGLDGVLERTRKLMVKFQGTESYEIQVKVSRNSLNSMSPSSPYLRVQTSLRVQSRSPLLINCFGNLNLVSQAEGSYLFPVSP